jgi:hypothetical protein
MTLQPINTHQYSNTLLDGTQYVEESLESVHRMPSSWLHRYSTTRPISNSKIEAKQTTSSESYVELLSALVKIANPWSLTLRAETSSSILRVGSKEDLNSAVEAFQDAIELTPMSHPARQDRLSNLGIALNDRLTQVKSMVPGRSYWHSARSRYWWKWYRPRHEIQAFKGGKMAKISGSLEWMI